MADENGTEKESLPGDQKTEQQTLVDLVVDKVKKAIPERIITVRTVQVAPTHIQTPALSSGNMFFIAMCITIAVGIPLASEHMESPAPAPVVNVEAPAITIDGSEIAESLMARGMDFDPQTGMFMPLPPAAEDVVQFREACRDVCRGDSHFSQLPRQGQESVPASRVLVNDPEHQVCTCFTGRHVWRYVGWQRQ